MSSVNLSWIVIGDFNSVISLDEHKGGFHYSYSYKAYLFFNFNMSNALLDVGFIGTKYTWCDNCLGFTRRWARLDHCLVNSN